MELPAARLRARELDLDPQPFEERHGRASDLG
jgi:hypothetical protein